MSGRNEDVNVDGKTVGDKIIENTHTEREQEKYIKIFTEKIVIESCSYF